MSRILRTTLATAFAAACMAGASVTFAADNNNNNNSGGGNIGNTDGHQTMSRNSPDETEKVDPGTTGAISTCDDKTSDQHASCYDGLPKMK